MKSKGVKLFLIIILALIAIALINFMIYALINNNKDSKVKLSLFKFGNNTEKIFEKEYNPEDLDKIQVNVSSSNVRIEKVDSDKIKIIAYGDKDEKIKESIKEKELLISKENTKIFIFAMFYWSKEEIIIQVPNKECNEEFEIHTSSGDIIAPDLDTNNIQFESSSGKIECGNINNGKLKSSSGNISVANGNEVEIQASSGSIKAGNFNKITAEASSGKIEIGTIEEGTVKTSSGRITIEGAKKIQAEASSGKIDINTIEEYCHLTTSSGSIDVDSLNITENSYISAKSGSVSIKSKNDIYVEANSNSGGIDIKNNNRKSDIELKVTTTSGSINIE